MKLASQRYGKARVRVLKILRDKERQSIVEIDVAVLLEGDFESSYTSGDNTKVVPTDTVKNTINILTKQHLGEEIEPFAIKLGEHFLGKYKQVQAVTIDIDERDWRRMDVDGKPHQHSFVAGGNSKTFTHVRCTSDGHEVESGVRDLIILKSTGSGFEDYPKCDFTTLPETADRILATSLRAAWRFDKKPSNYRERNMSILQVMLKVFAENFSPSAQTTLFQMAEAALNACPEISRIELAMPNKHYLPINLSPFKLENKNEVFTPTDEPHGQIEAVVTR